MHAWSRFMWSFAGCVVAGALVVMGVAMTLVPAAGAAEYAHPDLRSSRTDSTATVAGTHFELTWDAYQAGELTSIRLHDGAVWQELMGGTQVRPSTPGLRLVTAAGDFRPRGHARIEWIEQSGDRVVVRVDTPLASETGAASPFAVRHTYTVYPEGAVFIDFEIEVVADAAPVQLERASLGWPTSVGYFPLQRWHWRRAIHRGGRFLEPERTFRAAPCPNAGAALGWGDEFTNHIQVSLEHSRVLGGDSANPVGIVVTPDLYFVYHLRPHTAGPVELPPAYRYSNRFAIFLGRQPQRDPLIGQRLVFWTEGTRGGMAIPTASALEAMADCGASGVILGPGWRRGGTDDPLPADASALTRVVRDAHDVGLEVLAHVMAGGEPLELAGLVARFELDGLYVDRGSAHHHWIGDPATEFPARATFEWGHALRRALGPGALLIGNDAVDGPDLSIGLALSGVVFGEEIGDHKAERDPLLTAYLGGQGYGVPCPLATPIPLRRERALAAYAACGAVPLVPLGKGEERSAYRAARWVLPLWQIYRVVPEGATSYGLHSGMLGRSNRNFSARVMRASPDVAMLVTSNLAEKAAADSAAFELRYEPLAFDGEYAVEEIRALDLETFESIHLGRSSDGKIFTELMLRYGVRGFALLRGAYPPMVALALDQVNRLARAYTDVRPPSRPPAPAVIAEPGLMRIEWEPATDDHHVEAYRVFRSPTEALEAATLVELPTVYEATACVDFGVAPGDSAYYTVLAVDQMDNEGLPAPTRAAHQPGATWVMTFEDSTAAAADLELLSGAWEVSRGSLCHGCTPDATPLATALLRDVSARDLDMRVTIEGREGYGYSGGLLFGADPRGDGYVLYLGDPNESWLVLGLRQGAEVTPIERVHYPYTAGGYQRDNPNPHLLRVVKSGSEIKASCDGTELVRITDDTFSGGRVGFVAFRGMPAFDNVAVQNESVGGP